MAQFRTTSGLATPAALAPLPGGAPRTLKSVYSLEDLEARARRRLPRCVFGYAEGGVEDNVARDGNRRAFAAWTLRPRVLVGAADRVIETPLFGQTWAAPFGIAPMGAASLFAFEAERALAEAALATNIPFILSGGALMRLETIIAANPEAWFQAYLTGDRPRMTVLLARIAAAGYRKLVVTVDVSAPANRENNLRTGFSIPLRPTPKLLWDGLSHPSWLLGVAARSLVTGGLPHIENAESDVRLPILAAQIHKFFGRRYTLSWDDVAWLRDNWKGTLIIKGVLAGADAALAVKAGVDGVIVSNHGGRQLDGAISTLGALPEVAGKAAGMTVMMDSGVRRGTDVMKALALGADFTFVGRPFLYAAAIGGKLGVMHAINLLALEIDRNLAMMGCASPAALGPEHLAPAPR